MATIRPMKESDILQVKEVAITSWHDTYEGLIPKEIREKFLANAYSEETLLKKLKGSVMFVAVMEDNIVGFAHFTPVTDDGDSTLAAIYLLPETQGRGIGSQLIERGMNELKGLKVLHVEVERQNDPAKRFYEAKGFQVVEEYTENFAGHELQTIRMKKEITH